MILQKRNLYMSHQDYAYMLELYGRHARFDDDSRFCAEVASHFHLRPFTEYQIVIDR